MAGPICSKCNLEMRPGFVPEYSRVGFTASVWHPDLPKKLRDLGGLAKLLAAEEEIAYDKERVMAIEAWRCDGCGRVEFFAGRLGGK